MKRISISITTDELCHYGCGQIAKYKNGSGNLMCSERHNSCPANKKKNSEGVKSCGRDYSETYRNLSQETKEKMKWSKGLTKETDERVLKNSLKQKGKKFGSSVTGHSEETKQKLSKFRTEWLKKSENRKNLGRHKKSWMELTFEYWLDENKIEGWISEKHFWSDELKKNFYPDYLFEDKKLIIELDGNQHLKTIEQDIKRDEWFKSIGYFVVRISHKEFKDRFFNRKGFFDLLGC